MSTRLLPIEPARRTDLDAKLAAPDRLAGKPVELVYPGSGWDFKSFWPVADPTRAFLFDPAPVTNFSSPLQGIGMWQAQLIGQLNPAAHPPVIQFAYDVSAGAVGEMSNEEVGRLTQADCSEGGQFRLALSSRVIIRNVERIVTFVAARFQEIGILRVLSIPTNLHDIAALNEKWPIVYEHKSMVSTPILERSIAPGGCLIWGLPDDAPRVQWLSIYPQQES